MAICNYLQLCSLILCIGRIFAEFDEGSPCTLENNGTGVCKLIMQCPSRVEEVRQGRRYAQSSRCGFSGFDEIVCCPTELKAINQTRPSILAYQYYLTNVAGTIVDFHILNGTEASSRRFPYMVALGYRDDSKLPVITIDYKCGGTIITETFILTAAHCVNNINGFVPILVRAGTESLTGGEGAQTVGIAQVIKHPNHILSRSYYDIALLKLSSQLQWTMTVQPISLISTPIDGVEFHPSVSFVTIGWGFTEFNGKPSDKLLQSPNLELIPSSDCNRLHGRTFRIPNGLDGRILCAKDKDTTRRADTCQGDSGGPLLMLGSGSDTIVGITSFGRVCGSPVFPGVYTSVYHYLDWIEAVVWPHGFSAILYQDK